MNAEQEKPLFEVHAPGVDAAALVEDIRRTVERKRAEGHYADPAIVRAERANLSNLRDDEDFFALYMSCLRQAYLVDINDFEIVERRPRFARFFVAMKRTIWNLLRFYTYRLWSQQNQVNGLLLSAIEGTELKARNKIRELEERVAKLEQRVGDP